MPIFDVEARPAKGEPQTFKEERAGEAIERPYLRSITLEAEDEEDARAIVEEQSLDISRAEAEADHAEADPTDEKAAKARDATIRRQTRKLAYRVTKVSKVTGK